MPAIKLSTPKRREAMRESLWPGSSQVIFPAPHERGWFQAPRTLPLILALLDDRALSGKMDLSRTYLGLLADNYGQGIVEIHDESEYAVLAGLKGSRGVRSWRERIAKLKELEFIDVKHGVGGRVNFVLILQPKVAITKLHAAGKVPDEWFTTYTALMMATSGAYRREARVVAGEDGTLQVETVEPLKG